MTPSLSPLVSVIIPTFNHAAYLGDAIHSVLAQTHGPCEIVVIDDGSTDESSAVAAQFGDRIRYYWQQNQGLSAARNAGLAAASGDYIALLDADDLLEPTYVETLLALLAKHHDADGAYAGYRFVDQDNQPLSRVERRIVAPERLHAALLNGNFFVPESLLMRRACYAAAGPFDRALRACEDWDMWLRVSRVAVLVGCDAVLVRYRVVAGSMSSDPARMLAYRHLVLAKQVGTEPRLETASAAAADPVREAYGRAYLRAVVEYLERGDEENAYNCLRQAARLFPPLLTETATYYELALGGQERGRRGDAQGVNLAERERWIERTLVRLRGEADLAPLAGAQTGPAAVAALALGALYYQRGDMAPARRALRHALRLNPRLVRRRDFLALWGRATVGANNIRWARQRLGQARRA